MITCSDCDSVLTADEATPARLRLGERLCNSCWEHRLDSKTLPFYYTKLEEDCRLIDALLDGLFSPKSAP